MTHRDLTHDELFTLTERQLEAAANASDLARLNALLTESSDNRRRYLAHLQLHGEMHWQTTDADKRLATTPGSAPLKPGDALVPGRNPTPLSAAAPIYRKRRAPKPIPFIIYPISIAAAALLTAAIVVVYLLAFTTAPQPDPIQPNQPRTPGPAVATLIEISGGGDLRTPHGYPAEGEDFSAGEYTLTSGGAEFMLTNAVNVKLRGDSRMVMRNDMNVALTQGTAEFVVPKDATGFAVALPDGSRIVDLGTAFRVTVDDDNRASVVVSQGRVRVEHGGGAKPRIVEAGQGVALTATGYRERVEHRVELTGRIEGNAHAANHNVATFGLDDLMPGDTVVVDLDVEPVDPKTPFQWFAIVANAQGRGWPTTAGGLLRTDRITQRERFDQHQITENNRVTDIGAYTDPGVGNGGGRIRLDITLVDGFDAEAEFRLRIDDDRDGEFDHDTTGRFAVGSQLTIALATDAGAHTYETVAESSESDIDSNPSSPLPRPVVE